MMNSAKKKQANKEARAFAGRAHALNPAVSSGCDRIFVTLRSLDGSRQIGYVQFRGAAVAVSWSAAPCDRESVVVARRALYDRGPYGRRQ